MIKAIYKYFHGIPEMYIDGFLYGVILVFGFVQTYLTTDDAEKYISGVVLFYVNGIVGMFLALASGIKMFRSNSFTQHKEELKAQTTTPKV